MPPIRGQISVRRRDRQAQILSDQSCAFMLAICVIGWSPFAFRWRRRIDSPRFTMTIIVLIRWQIRGIVACIDSLTFQSGHRAISCVGFSGQNGLRLSEETRLY